MMGELDQDSSKRVMQRLNAVHTLKAEATAFAIRSYIECEREQIVKDALKVFWLKQLEEWSCHKLTTEETGIFCNIQGEC